MSTVCLLVEINAEMTGEVNQFSPSDTNCVGPWLRAIRRQLRKQMIKSYMKIEFSGND